MARIFEIIRILSPLRRTRESQEWEVVDHKMVQPVPTFFDDEDVDILWLSQETKRTYVFDLHVRSAPGNHKRSAKLHKRGGEAAPQEEQSRKALIFARQMLLAEIAKKECNCLLQEGWCLTVFRKGRRHRIEVEYYGRGALAWGKSTSEDRQPPFMELLKSN